MNSQQDNHVSPLEQRAALAAELETAQSNLAALAAERKRIEPQPSVGANGLYSAGSPNPRYGEVLGELSQAESKVESLQSQIAYLDKIIDHENAVSGAVATAQDARLDMEQARARLGKLKGQIAHLAGRIEALTGEAEAIETESMTMDEQAVGAYAKAVAAADGKAEKAAQAQLNAAQEAGPKTVIAVRQKRSLAEALRQEAEQLASQAEAAKDAVQTAERRMLGAIETRLGHEFDIAAQELLDLLARIVCARKAMGRDAFYLLRDLAIPRFGVGLDRFRGDDVSKIAAGLGIDDLLAELGVLVAADQDQGAGHE